MSVRWGSTVHVAYIHVYIQGVPLEDWQEGGKGAKDFLGSELWFEGFFLVCELSRVILGLHL